VESTGHAGLSANIDYTAPSFAAQTVRDDMVELTLTEPFANAQGEWAAVIGATPETIAFADADTPAIKGTGSYVFDATAVRYKPVADDDYSEGALADVAAGEEPTTIYLTSTGATWKTDATGTFFGGTNSTDSSGNLGADGLPKIFIPFSYLR